MEQKAYTPCTHQAVGAIAAACRAAALAIGWDVARAGGVCVQVGCQCCGKRQVLGQAGRIEPGIVIRNRHALHTQAQPVSNGISCRSGLD